MAISSEIRQGHVLDVLRTLPSESVHMVVTSPPYWGLRDYGLEPQVWGGDDPTCEHEWREYDSRTYEPGQGREEMAKVWTTGGKPKAGTTELRHGMAVKQGECSRCHAWRGSLGLEPTPSLYVDHIVEIFREARRVLRDDGTCWVNLGDCYATGAGKVGDCPGGGGGAQGERFGEHHMPQTPDAKNPGAMVPRWQPNRMPLSGLKPKDLVMMPARVAMALQADGWYLRSDIIWAKPNPMPESVTDRPTKSHEYVFLLSKSASYYYDHAAILEPVKPESLERATYAPSSYAQTVHNLNGRRAADGTQANAEGRNRRSVWTIATQPYPDAHFATFPEALVRPCILAGTSERGVCAECRAPWQRVVERVDTGVRQNMADGWATHEGGHGLFHRDGREVGKSDQPVIALKTTGWRPTCAHASESVPARVLDPFCGSGTTLLVAQNLGRSAIGIDLSPAYVKLAEARLAQAALL